MGSTLMGTSLNNFKLMVLVFRTPRAPINPLCARVAVDNVGDYSVIRLMIPVIFLWN